MLKFGTGGWRAIIGDDFIKTNVRQFALMLSHIAYEESDSPKPIVVGYDNRFLSKEASEWLIEIFNSLGIETYTYKTSIPTPLLMYYVKSHNLDYGVMVTASHNPYNYNGLKLIVKGGLDAPTSLTDRFDDVEADWFTPIKEQAQNNYILAPYTDYEENIFSLVNAEDIIANSDDIHIYFNGMGGSGSDLFCSILDELKINYSTYHTTPDPYFNNGVSRVPEPSVQNCTEFINNFKKHNSMSYVLSQISSGETSAETNKKNSKYNLGIVFDGDGDRLLVIDEEGQVADMNSLLCLFYWYSHAHRNEKGAVVRNSVTTSVLDRMAAVFGEECIEVPVGFKWITKSIVEHDAVIGGESSGGCAFRGHIYGKDSILSALYLIEILCKTKQSLHLLLDFIYKRFGSPCVVDKKIPYSTEEEKENLIKYIDSIESDEATVSDLDGKKFTFSNGRWVSFRFSGTEPILRVMAEARTVYEAEELLQKTVSSILDTN